MKRESRPIHVLLVEDNPSDADLLREVLTEAATASVPFQLTQVERLDEAVRCLRENGFDVVLLDLSLPDSQGLATLARIHAEARDVPVVVLTGLDDERLAIRAVHEGAQDYLVKGQIANSVLVRAIRYAIERHRLQAELEMTRQRERHEREMRSFERASGSNGAAVTARLYGTTSLQESIPDTFTKLVERYEALLDRALEQQAYRVEHNTSEGLYCLAEQIGLLKAGPRSVVEVHSTALQKKSSETGPQKAQAYIEEGRLMAFELMGHLVSFYRNRSVGMTTDTE